MVLYLASIAGDVPQQTYSSNASLAEISLVTVTLLSQQPLHTQMAHAPLVPSPPKVLLQNFHTNGTAEDVLLGKGD